MNPRLAESVREPHMRFPHRMAPLGGWRRDGATACAVGVPAQLTVGLLAKARGTYGYSWAALRAEHLRDFVETHWLTKWQWGVALGWHVSPL